MPANGRWDLTRHLKGKYHRISGCYLEAMKIKLKIALQKQTLDIESR
jgi:hypothetical protein